VAKNHDQTEPLLTVREIAKELQLSESTVEDWARRGILPGFKIGRLWRFRPAAYRAWQDAHRGIQRIQETEPEPMESFP